MAMGCHGTYTFIPPPPLPEFYRKKTDTRRTTSTSSSASEDFDSQAEAAETSPNFTDGAYDGKPRRVTIALAPETPLMTMPPPPPGMKGNKVPPLAIYHICRVCLRPRSSRYHREHPIPLDGLPPPPGICRRCRITSVEDTKRVADIIKIGESNDIKIGFITPFVSDEAIISNEEARARHVEKYLQSKSSDSDSKQSRRSRKDIVYRHVRVLNEPEDTTPERQTKVKFTTQQDESSSDDCPLPEPPQRRVTAATSMQVQPTAHPPSVMEKTVMVSAQHETSSSQISTSTRSSTASSITEKGPLKMSNTEPKYTGSEVRRIARDELERYRDEYWKNQCSDSNIRRIAREEVERYREAERKLEAHPDPYAHGRMVPVSRRIEQERDVPVPHPWIEITPDKKEELTSVASTRSQRKNEASVEQDKFSINSNSYDEKSRSSAISSQPRPDTARPRDRLTVRVERRSDARAAESNSFSIGRKDSKREKEVVAASGDDRSSTTVRPTRNKDPKSGGKTFAITRETRPMCGEKTRSGAAQRLANPKKATETFSTQEDQTWSRSSKSMRRDNWYEEIESAKVENDGWERCEPPRSDRPQLEIVKDHSQRAEESSKRNAAAKKAKRSDIDTLETDKVNSRRSDREIHLRGGEGPPYPQTDADFTQMEWAQDDPATKSSKRRPHHNEPSKRDDEVEYLYAERIVQPANRPLGRRPFDDHAPAQRVEIEEVVETWRHPPPSSRSSRYDHNRDGAAFTGSSRDCEADSTAYGSNKQRSVRSRQHEPMGRNVDVPPQSRQHETSTGHGKRDQSDCEELNHVHFSGDVDVSPTPPDSDASSSEFRAYHSVDGKTSDQPDGRQSTHSGRYSSKGSDRPSQERKSGSRASHKQNKKRLPTLREELDGAHGSAFEDQGYRRHSGVDEEKSSAHGGLDEGSPRRGRNEDRRADQKFKNGAKDGNLARALSESPSREASSSSFGLDGRGPYRVEEKITDSLWVQDGSSGERLVDEVEETFYTGHGDERRRRHRRRG